jgi:hypothetical protein
MPWIYSGLDAASKGGVEREPRDEVESEASVVSGSNSGVHSEATAVQLEDAVDENIIREDCKDPNIATGKMEAGQRMGVAGTSLRLRHVVIGSTTTSSQ